MKSGIQGRPILEQVVRKSSLLVYLFFNVLFTFLGERERESARERICGWGRGGERGTEDPKKDDSCKPNAGLELTNGKIVT